MKNIRPLDQFIRLLLAIALFQAGYFWLALPWSWVAYGVGAILLLTGGLRVCPLYAWLGWRPGAKAPAPNWLRLAAAAVLLAALVGGSIASHVLTRQQFLADYNHMNGFYKQTLFLTGQAKREAAIAQYEQLRPAFAAFQARYSHYRPHALKSDAQLDADLHSVEQMIQGVGPLVRNGDLQQAHLDLEQVRPIFQNILKRNGVSLLAVALVDFHDAMETVLHAAAASDAKQILALYPSVSDKLQAVEAAENDAAIQAIRANLEAVKTAAEQGDTAGLGRGADALKASFVKVYLKRG